MEPNEMKRYDIGYDEDGYEMGLESDGEWVKHSDAMQIITALQAKIDGMIKRPVVDYERYEKVTVNGVVILGDVGDAWWINHEDIADNLTKALGMDEAKEGGSNG